MKEILEKLKDIEKLVEEKSQNCKCGSIAKDNKVELSTFEPGDRFDTELGKMIVLGHDVANGTTKVIQDDFFKEDVKFDNNSCDYIKSDLKKLFDREVAEAYAKIFSDALVEHEVNLKSVDTQDYGSFKCKVRPITFDEAREFNPFIVKKELDDWWWTCTPWSTSERGWKYSVSVVSPSGSIRNRNFSSNCGVRPFCILKSNIFVSKGE